MLMGPFLTDCCFLLHSSRYGVDPYWISLIKIYYSGIKLISSSVSDTQNILYRCVKALSWAGMYFRAEKSRSLVIVRVKSMNAALFYVTEP